MSQIEAYCQTTDQFFDSGNGQNIREMILRLAVNNCRHYSTDAIILLAGKEMRDRFEAEKQTLWVYFREYGVDWNFGKDGDGECVAKACLRKDGDVYTLNF